MTVIAFNGDGARISDWVNLSLESKYFLSAALVLYGLPLLALLAGVMAGYYGAAGTRFERFGPIAGLIAGVVFTLATYFIIRAFDNKIKKSLYIPIAHMDTK